MKFFLIGFFLCFNLVFVLCDKEFSCKNLKDGKYEYPDDCYKYYLCYDGERYEGKCKEGSYFDKKERTCKTGTCPTNPPDVPDEDIQCKKVTPKPIIESNEEYYIKSSTFYTYNDTTEEPEYHTSNQSCRIYYYCCDGKPIKMECDQFFYWNPVKKQCDYRENVECDVSHKIKLKIILLLFLIC